MAATTFSKKTHRVRVHWQFHDQIDNYFFQYNITAIKYFSNTRKRIFFFAIEITKSIYLITGDCYFCCLGESEKFNLINSGRMSFMLLMKTIYFLFFRERRKIILLWHAMFENEKWRSKNSRAYMTLIILALNVRQFNRIRIIKFQRLQIAAILNSHVGQFSFEVLLFIEIKFKRFH